MNRDRPGQGLLFDADRFCLRCGRRLRTPRSALRGYGVSCWRKLPLVQRSGAVYVCQPDLARNISVKAKGLLKSIDLFLASAAATKLAADAELTQGEAEK